MVGRYRRIERGTAEELAPLREDETRVRVWTELTDEAWQTIAAWLTDHPTLHLSVERGEDLEMLRWFPNLRRLAATSLHLRSLDGLRHVAGSLERLTIGDTIPRVSLRPLGALGALRRLAVNGTWRDMDTIGRLTGLRRLGVGSIDLGLLRPLQELERFESGLGVVGSLELLPQIGRLELVGLYRLRGEHDLAPLARLPHLRWLILEATGSITTLPSFRDSRELRWVTLDAMKGIRDLRPVAEAPNLEVLLLIGMRQLQPDDLRPLVGHPTLRAGIWGLGSRRRNDAAQALLPLTTGSLGPAPWDRPDWTGIRHWNAGED
jgi:hypothetical protein